MSLEGDALKPGLQRAVDILDDYLTMHPNSPDGKDIYHLMRELEYLIENPEDDDDEPEADFDSTRWVQLGYFIL